MKNTLALLFLSTSFSLILVSPAFADDNAAAVKALQAQIATLQQQIAELSKKVNAQQAVTQAAAPAPAQVPAPQAPVASAQNNIPPQAYNAVSLPPVSPQPEPEVAAENKFRQPIPGVKLTPGGFLEIAGIERSKNETTDTLSNFNTSIPFNNSVNAHQTEFRGSARASRLSLLAEGSPDKDTHLSGYVETDFLGAAPTATSTESNSYNPRLRQAFATFDKDDWGFHFLGGQAYSLLTLDKSGLSPMQIATPMTIDGDFVPGFAYTRNPQIRVAEDFDDKKIWAGLSLESPQANLNGITVPTTVNATNTGVSPLNTSGSYSTDLAPDIIAKLAFDPGWGHYEVFGITRFFHDNVLSTFHNNTVVASGGGVGTILPVIPKLLDFQAQGMVGDGIGRYGPALLPDFAFAPNGAIKPLNEYMAMVGAIAHPTSTWDLYTYTGIEKIQRDNQANTTYGYGDLALNNSGCVVENGSCSAQTSEVWQITPGLWKQVYQGKAGMMKVGLQDSLTRREAFSDSHGNAPHSYENIVMTSFRYYPF